MKQGKRYLALCLIFALLLCTLTATVGCKKQEPSEQMSEESTEIVSGSKKEETESNKKKWRLTDEVTNYVKINVQGYGEMIIELDPEAAPITVENFKQLVKDRFYHYLTFHRCLPNQMVQGGDPNGNGTGGSGTTIFGEFSANGYDNPLSHTRGVISMARDANDFNSASSQFFICSTDVPEWDGQYAAFGKVIEGFDVLDELVSVPILPLQQPEILSIRFVYQ